MIAQILIFFLTFFIFALAVIAFLSKYFNKLLKKPEQVIIGLGLAPLLVSLVLFFLLLIFPDKANSFYVTGVFIFFILILFTSGGLAEIKNIIKIDFSRLKNIKKIDKDILVMCFFPVLVAVYIFYQAIAFPISSHDGTIYEMLGRIIYRERNLANFPMSTPDQTGFYFTGGQHPPGLPLIYTWSHLLADNTSDFFARTVSPMYALYLGIFLWLVIKERTIKIGEKISSYSAILGVLFLAITPAFVWQAFENSIDPLRMFWIFADFFILWKLIEKKDLKLLILLGFTTGLTLYSHASGTLVFAVLSLLLVLFLPFAFWKKNYYTIIFAIIAITVGGTQYVLNYFEFHNILGPSSYNLTQVKIKNFYSPTQSSFVNQSGNISVTPKIAPKFEIPKQLIYGRLQVFTRPELFGLSYYFFIIALIYWLKFKKKEKIDKVFLWGIIFIALPVIYKFYLNRRYILTIHPLVVYFGGIFAGQFYANLKKKNLAKWFWLALMGIPLAIGGILLSSHSVAEKLISKGGSNQLNYFLSNKHKQSEIITPGVFEAIDYINKETPKDSVILSFDDSRFYYFADRKGVDMQSPQLDSFYLSENKEESYKLLLDLDVDYILVDVINQESYQKKSKKILDFLADNQYSTLVYDGISKVYKINK